MIMAWLKPFNFGCKPDTSSCSKLPSIGRHGYFPLKLPLACTCLAENALVHSEHIAKIECIQEWKKKNNYAA